MVNICHLFIFIFVKFRERSENKRHEVELLMETHLHSINELKKRVDELTIEAEEGASLHDQLEEYKLVTERMHKLEGTLEKYKGKIEETSDLKRQIKVKCSVLRKKRYTS